jgi:hypothetical protein
MNATSRWLGIGLLATLAGCGSEPVAPGLPPGGPPPQLLTTAIRLDVDLVEGTVRVASPQVETASALPRSNAILGSNEVTATATNLTRSAPGAFQPGKVRVRFDVAITNRLTSATLVPSTLNPGSTATGLILFPYRVTQATGGATSSVLASVDWNGDGTTGSGAPRNFFNDFACTTTGITSDCIRWEQFASPLFAGETSRASRVGFDVPKAVTSFQVLLVLAADVSSDLPAVARVAVTPASYIMADGYSAGFAAVAYDALNNPLPWATIHWTSNDPTAVQFQYGSALVNTWTGPSAVVHGRKVGQSSFTASSGGITTTVPIDIQVNTIVLVQLYLPDSSLTVGDQVQGDPRVKDNSGGIVPGFLPTWSSSDPNVATVDANGLVTAVGPGNATITATAAAASGSVDITVAAPVVSSIQITPPNYVMADGRTASFSAMAYDQSNHPMPSAVITWTSNPVQAAFQSGSSLVAAITGPSVIVHGRLDGVWPITASSGSASAVAQLDVQVRTIVLVQVYSTDSSMTAGEQQQTQVSVKDNSGLIVDFPVTWTTSDATVATVDANGLFTALQPGTVDIIATSAAVSDNMPLTVTPIP